MVISVGYWSVANKAEWLWGREWATVARCKQLVLRRRRQLYNEQNNCSARASRFLVHFFDVYCATTTLNLLIWRFMDDVDRRRRIFLHLFFLNKILKNSTPFQIDAIKFERTQILGSLGSCLATFSLPSSTSLLKVPNSRRVRTHEKNSGAQQEPAFAWPRMLVI